MHYVDTSALLKRYIREAGSDEFRCRGGTGLQIIGHHELMLPLLFTAVREAWKSKGR